MSIFFMDAHMHFDLYKDRKFVVNYIENQKSYTISVTNLPDLFEKYYLDYQKYKYITQTSHIPNKPAIMHSKGM